MILFSAERYIPLSPGYITLQNIDDGEYYYVNRVLYEQAVILTDRYENNIIGLQHLIGGKEDNLGIQLFTDYVPKPLKIMGYFLALVDADIESFEDAIGALYVISSAINLRNLITQPAEIRQSVKFSLNIREEYIDAWDYFFDQCATYEYVKSCISGETRVGVAEDSLDADDELAKYLEEMESLNAPKSEEVPVKETVKPTAELDGGLAVVAKAKRRAL